MILIDLGSTNNLLDPYIVKRAQLKAERGEDIREWLMGNCLVVKKNK